MTWSQCRLGNQATIINRQIEHLVILHFISSRHTISCTHIADWDSTTSTCSSRWAHRAGCRSSITVLCGSAGSRTGGFTGASWSRRTFGTNSSIHFQCVKTIWALKCIETKKNILNIPKNKGCRTLRVTIRNSLSSTYIIAAGFSSATLILAGKAAFWGLSRVGARKPLWTLCTVIRSETNSVTSSWAGHRFNHLIIGTSKGWNRK